MVTVNRRSFDLFELKTLSIKLKTTAIIKVEKVSDRYKTKNKQTRAVWHLTEKTLKSLHGDYYCCRDFPARSEGKTIHHKGVFLGSRYIQLENIGRALRSIRFVLSGVDDV